MNAAAGMGGWPARLYFAAVLAVLLAPLVILLLGTAEELADIDGDRFGHALFLWRDADVAAAIRNSAAVAFGATLVALVLGGYLALGLHRAAGAGIAIALTPVLVPAAIQAGALVALFGPIAESRALPVLMASHAGFGIGVVALLCAWRLRRIGRAMVEASADLGADRATMARYLLVPVLLPLAVPAGLVLFALSLGDFAREAILVRDVGAPTLAPALHAAAASGGAGAGALALVPVAAALVAACAVPRLARLTR